MARRRKKRPTGKYRKQWARLQKVMDAPGLTLEARCLSKSPKGAKFYRIRYTHNAAIDVWFGLHETREIKAVSGTRFVKFMGRAREKAELAISQHKEHKALERAMG